MLQHSPRAPALRAADNLETTDYNIVRAAVRKAEERSFMFGLLGRDRATAISCLGGHLAARAVIPQQLGERRVHDPVQFGP